ncbi:MAG: outer membrane beta-barrel protein [Bacteroidaceae bacterium]|nr:outer membrane beta-barrel protein [Bacteroidaceae bacterium]
MKKYLFILVAMFAMSTAAFAQKGITSFGLQGAYDDFNGQFGVGAKLQYGFVDQFRGEVGADLFFKKNDLSMFDINANFHFVVPVVADKFNVYPLAGANIAFFNHDIPTRLGLNLGGGLEYFVTDKVKIIGEAKYIISDNGFSRFGANLGVGFLF